MTNLEYLKLEWLIKVVEWSPLEAYERLLSNEPMINGVCKYCGLIYGFCKDDLDGDTLCKERFNDWCSREKEFTYEELTRLFCKMGNIINLLGKLLTSEVAK